MRMGSAAVLGLLLHGGVCLWVLWKRRKKVGRGCWPVVLLVPLWGPLSVLWAAGRTPKRQGERPGMEKLRVNEELHQSILVEGRDTAAGTVPLEEALIVDSAEQRRKLILSVLTDEPVQYYDLLQQARMNEDSEVVHYAATAMAQISKQADLALQQYERQYQAAPQDSAVLAEYSAYLEEYLASGLAQGRAAELQRRKLEQLLQQQQTRKRNYLLGCRLVSVQLQLEEYDAAELTLAELVRRWPVRETPWLLRLRSAAARRDGAAVREILRQMERNHVYLSAAGRREVDFWRKGGTS